MILFLVGSLQLAAKPVSAHFGTLAPDTDVQLYWSLDNSYSLSINLKIVKSPESQASVFWGHQFTFMNGETGYIALGIGGNLKVATIGAFNALNGMASNPDGACNAGIAFLKSGNGYQCFIPYNWKIGFNYQLHISRLADSNANEQWQGSIHDYSTNSTTIIGSLIVPRNYGQLAGLSSTWDEYSTAASCSTTPTSVIFSDPYATNTAGNHTPFKAQVTYGNSTCQDSNVQHLGGGAYQSDAGNGVTRTTAAQTWLWTEEPKPNSQKTTSVSL